MHLSHLQTRAQSCQKILKGAKGTGHGGSRTGVTIEPRETEFFKRPLIYGTFPWKKPVSVSQQCEDILTFSAQTFHQPIPIQLRHTVMALFQTTGTSPDQIPSARSAIKAIVVKRGRYRFIKAFL
jgi:hypothetical protein